MKFDASLLILGVLQKRLRYVGPDDAVSHTFCLGLNDTEGIDNALSILENWPKYERLAGVAKAIDECSYYDDRTSDKCILWRVPQICQVEFHAALKDIEAIPKEK